YFLLRNIINQVKDEKNKHKDIITYLFSRLDNCPKRKQDINLYKEIIHSNNKALKEAFLKFAQLNAKQCQDIALRLIKSYNKKEKFFGFCILIHLPENSCKETLKEFIINTKNMKFIKEFLNYIYYYGNEKDKDCLENLQKQFPELKEQIQRIIKSL
ncbi:hypothetical protein, partial [Hydrogenivirga sp. 128-5-R1-1]|uniref:hypothetical protein n=1 Tax=Hydrogenivirga sp. 128-5-R1-1 TaxID=392423 RepID=UPI00015F10D6